MVSSRKKKYDAYIASDAWAKVRTDIIYVRGNKCEKCGSKRGINIHHLTYDNLGNEEPEDLIVLCRKCHMLEHGLVKKKKRKTKRIYVNNNKKTVEEITFKFNGRSMEIIVCLLSSGEREKRRKVIPNTRCKAGAINKFIKDYDKWELIK